MELPVMKIAIASGKGGTGKTTVAVNLASFLAQANQQVQYIDCDVEEPNGHLFLRPEIHRKTTAQVMVPIVDEKKCTACGECGAKCQYHAIVNLPKETLIFPELCHGCGLCTLLCPEGAITEGEREIGYIEEGSSTRNIDFLQGVLRIGEPMAVPLIRMVKKEEKENRLRIIDAPPGTSCPVVATLADADVVVMVTEPTPFGLHDLKIAVSVAHILNIPTGIVINRSQGEYAPLAEYLKSKGLMVLAEIPEDREIAARYSRGEIIIDALPLYRDYMVDLVENIGFLSGKYGREDIR